MIINRFNVKVVRKDVKNINLKVYPNLKIKASVPHNMDISSVKRIIISKETWLKERLKKYEEQIRTTKRKYISGEDHYLNGKRYILKVVDSNTPLVKKAGSKTIIMYVRKSSSIENKEKIMNLFYKEQLTIKLEKYLPELEKMMNVKCAGYSIRKMKNKWGSCNCEKNTIIFNIDLAKKKDAEIKYVIIHELAHLIEKNHNEKFKKIMDYYYTKWEEYNKSINLLLNSNRID